MLDDLAYRVFLHILDQGELRLGAVSLKYRGNLALSTQAAREAPAEVQ
ncbi:hypothetical protein ADILRU_0172 [Leifsonia rubra CMS 76R]|nr:hypothetical protein ADILRU_0172 [Leifsonia rubra CMS 76R]